MDVVSCISDIPAVRMSADFSEKPLNEDPHNKGHLSIMDTLGLPNADSISE